MTPTEIQNVLADHAAWSKAPSQGARADLIGANLRGADLRGAGLRGADLIGADLRGADLIGADLRGADLTGADLTSANLTDANLTDADLTSADLTDAVGVDDVPTAPIPGLAAAVLQQIERHPETHDQSMWHSACNTKHCVAGWAVQLAGDVGAAAEERLCTATAARLLLGGEDHPFGEFDDPLPWLRERAGT
jgi:hypothetical protein